MRNWIGVGAAVWGIALGGQAAAGPYDDAHAAHLRGDSAAYLAIVRPLAEKGEARAQIDMASLYEDGWGGVAQDYAKAAFWIRKAADQGDADAESDLAMMYLKGEGVPQDNVQAEAWLKKAMDQGNKGSLRPMLALGLGVGLEGVRPRDLRATIAGFRQAGDKGDEIARAMLQTTCMTAPDPTPSDCAQVIVWARAAAEKGNAKGEQQLASLYDRGFPGLKQDPEQATAWYRKAADQGDERAESMLAMRYDMGEGVRQNPAQAVIWYRKAADQGDMAAQMSLAQRFEDDGVAHDDAQAFFWNRKVAEQGSDEAQRKVGMAYALGRGVTRDNVQAYMWLAIALASRPLADSEDHDAHAMALDSVASRMTPEQIAEAKRLVDAWKQKQMADAERLGTALEAAFGMKQTKDGATPEPRPTKEP